MQYRSIIVEDEKFLADQLQNFIADNCPEIEIIGVACSADVAAGMISELKPDLVFMDIELPGMNAFELLEKLVYRKFEIIFTTAHGHYALQAFDHNALHYLLKPITRESIKKAVQKFIQKKQDQRRPDVTEILNIMQGIGNPDKKIRLPRMNGFIMVPVKEIIRLQAEGRYTKVFIRENKSDKINKTPEMVSLNIKEFEEQLSNYNFFRCHHSHLVNLKNVKAYTKGEGGILTMENGENIPVSKTRKEALLKFLKEI